MAVKSTKKGANVADIRSPIYPEMGSFVGRGITRKGKAGHMAWGSGRKGSSR